MNKSNLPLIVPLDEDKAIIEIGIAQEVLDGS